MKMEALENLLQLPYQTLAILVAGYLSYRLAYTGRGCVETLFRGKIPQGSGR